MGDLHQKTIERSKQIIDAGFTLIAMWECQWLKTQEYKTTIKTCDIVEPLNHRDVFYGGRTNASKNKMFEFSLRQIRSKTKYGPNRIRHRCQTVVSTFIGRLTRN